MTWNWEQIANNASLSWSLLMIIGLLLFIAMKLQSDKR